ncbi:DUF559 domain-containing protein [Bifidobacterium sp. 82T25]|nr:DUF559 domain-containing protein [Bifidobacterium miconisargentati]
MNMYNQQNMPVNGEIQNYVQRELTAQATAKAAECQSLLARKRTEGSTCFSLHTALELYAIERPRQCTLPVNDFYITIRDGTQRSTVKRVSYRTWNQPFLTYVFPNGLVCMHPLDTWIQYAQYLNLDEMVILGEAIIRRFRYSVDHFRNRLKNFTHVVGRVRCEQALPLIQVSDSVQETRARLTLLRFGLSVPQMHYGITDTNGIVRYVVDMAYPDNHVAIEYDGDHHRRFRNQYVRDQRKRRDLRAMGWTVIEVFADDLWNEPNQRDFAQHVANALNVPLTGRPQHQFRALTDSRIAINARKGEYQRRQQTARIHKSQ